MMHKPQAARRATRLAWHTPLPLALVALAGCVFLSTACGGEESNAASNDTGNTDTAGTTDISSFDPDGHASDPDADVNIDADANTEPSDVCETLGCTCSDHPDCASGYCVRNADGRRECAIPCGDGCPTGYECRELIGSDGLPTRLCVRRPDRMCRACERDSDCGETEAVCYSFDDRRGCAPPCETDDECADTGTCQTLEVDGVPRRLCAPPEGNCVSCLDSDGDGYGVGPACLGPDCDDTNPNIHPGAEEICDGIDNNCNGVIDEGFDLERSLDHCGACNRRCRPPNGVGACIAGACRIVSCDFGLGDCNNDPSDGCEVNLGAANACELCTGGVEGTPCGVCDSGTWTCVAGEAVVCDGDLAEAAFNACGGCEILNQELGAPCDTCDGVYVCDGSNRLRCEPGVEGGCPPLPCEDGFYGPDCAPCSCVHGTCRDGRDGDGRCICNDGFGGDTCEDCATGFFGPTCQPCGCVGGLCDDGTEGSGRCDCREGFVGDRCEMCEDLHFGPECTPCACVNDGRCLEGFEGSGACDCPVGFGGALCERCDDDHFGPTCQPCSCRNDGACVDGFDGDGTCRCREGFIGDSCEACDRDHFGPDCRACDCANGGECAEGMDGDGTCRCREGFDGGRCDQCADGYFGPDCQPCLCVGGTCRDGIDGDGACTCNDTFEGDLCDQCVRDHFGPSCEPCRCVTGTCSQGIEGSGACRCTINFTGELCDQCSPGYYGPACSECECVNGTCFDGISGNGACLCTSNFAGMFCEACADDYYGPDCLPCPACPGGICDDGITGTGLCFLRD